MPADAPMRGQQCRKKARPFSVAVAMWWHVGGCFHVTPCKEALAGFQATRALKHSMVEDWIRLDGGENGALCFAAASVFGWKIFSECQQKESHWGVRRSCQGNVIALPSLSWPCWVNKWLPAPRLHTSEFPCMREQKCVCKPRSVTRMINTVSLKGVWMHRLDKLCPEIIKEHWHKVRARAKEFNSFIPKVGKATFGPCYLIAGLCNSAPIAHKNSVIDKRKILLLHSVYS